MHLYYVAFVGSSFKGGLVYVHILLCIIRQKHDEYR
jgi:hypothetical protein